MTLLICIILFIFLLILTAKIMYECFSNLFSLIWVILKFLIVISLIFLITRIVDLDLNDIFEKLKIIINQNILIDMQNIYNYLETLLRKFILENLLIKKY